MKVATPEMSQTEPPHVSASLVKLFSSYARGYARRHFHTLRILKSGLPPRDLQHSLVIFLNHASWWDPLICLLLAREFLTDHTSFAPIEKSMLKRYSFFKHLGFFGVESQTATGARHFLRSMRAILASSGNAVWITPQGRFMDVRELPLRLQKGLSDVRDTVAEHGFSSAGHRIHLLGPVAAGDFSFVWRHNYLPATTYRVPLKSGHGDLATRLRAFRTS